MDAKKMKVYKFGGTSVGTAKRMAEVARIIGSDPAPKIVVLSAMAGTTNTLVEMCDLCYAEKAPKAREIAAGLRRKYLEVVEELYRKGETKQQARDFVQGKFDALEGYLTDYFVIQDEKSVLSFGELLSTELFHMYLRENGVGSVLIPALSFMRTDRLGEPDMYYIAQNLQAKLEANPDTELFITQGYICLNAWGEVDNLRVTRELTFNADNYLISEKVSLATLGNDTRSVRVRYTVAADTSNAANTNYDAMRVAWDNGGSLGEETSTDKLTKEGVEASGKLYWAGPMSTYFLSAVMPGNADEARMVGRMQGSVYRVALEPKEVVVAPGQETTLEVSYWMGPKERKMLAAVSDQLALSVNLGMFSIIAKGLLWLLEFFQQYTHNWGLSIIMLTIVIKAVFWPLTAKSYSSMEKMKKLQPMMANIREKYKDNKEAMNKEVMALYKTYGVNPASGCVPILVQLPVFFGLYQALLTSIELRHAPFITYLPGTDLIWLADLSAKDPYYITPIIMGITMFLQQRMSPPATDPTQQKIMMFLPIVFTALFLSFPSGLVVYWLVNNILSIAQQWRMGRRNKLLAQ